MTKLQMKMELTLRELGCNESTKVSAIIVDSEKMAELNFKYRGMDGPTNVLSFSQVEARQVSADPDMLGDVVICSDRVKKDADELGYSYDEMLLYLTIHGLLHLVGYSHDSPWDASQMEDRVESIFQKLATA
jgi:probable rRNA maturation factor